MFDAANIKIQSFCGGSLDQMTCNLLILFMCVFNDAFDQPWRGFRIRFKTIHAHIYQVIYYRFYIFFFCEANPDMRPKWRNGVKQRTVCKYPRSGPIAIFLFLP